MWRASLAAVAVLAAAVYADDEPRDEPRTRTRVRDPDDDPDPRGQLARQVADEVAAIDRALVTVGERLGLVDTARIRRLAAAYRALVGRATPSDPATRMAFARRRAAARLLVERDLAERRLLAGETAQLRAAAARTKADAARVPEIELPTELGRPARGPVVRHFGTTEHERSKAALSRRGIDLEVDARAPALAPADGTVRHVGPIRGLDTGVIVDHGSYLTVIAKLGEVAVIAGAPVHRGDRLGRAARRRIYFEVRVELGPGGLPVDPEPLLVKPR